METPDSAMTQTELPVGPQLDAAVAKACGIEGYICDMRKVFLASGTPPAWVSEWLTSTIPLWRFAPSTDLNAAFEAAEKAGLFPDYFLWCKEVDDVKTWYVRGFGSGRAGGHVFGREIACDCTTPAEAICRAILELKVGARSDGPSRSLPPISKNEAEDNEEFEQ